MSEPEILDSRASSRRWRLPRPRLIRGRRWPSVLGVVVGVMALAVIAGTVTAGWLVQRPMPQTAGTLSVSGLEGDVEVYRDARGVPTIVATSSDDLFFAQGFVHAQDRFWEMDVRRHITAGRLSEMFGDSQVETDTFVRTLGWRRIAEQELSLLNQDTVDALTAYAAGVNEYLAERSPSEISLEYSLLGVTARDYTIEPWTPADSVAWLKAMAWDLRSNLVEETDRALVAPTVRSRVAQLYPPYPYDRHQPIVTSGGVSGDVFAPVGDSEERTASALAPVLPELFEGAMRGATLLDDWLGAYGPGVGSNSFAVTGDRSASGGALIANDPHLAPSLPGIWYQMNLRCEVVDAGCPFAVGGFTFSGVPGVVIGHNDRIAWAFTNNGSDVTDLAYEAINGDGYVRDGDVVPFDSRLETIEVAGGQPVEVTVRSTEWGPMLSDVSDPHLDIATNAFNPADLPVEADARSGLL